MLIEDKKIIIKKYFFNIKQKFCIKINVTLFKQYYNVKLYFYVKNNVKLYFSINLNA